MWYILILLCVNLMMPKLSSSSSTRSVENQKEKIEKKIKIETVFLERGLRLLRKMATNEDVQCSTKIK